MTIIKDSQHIIRLIFLKIHTFPNPKNRRNYGCFVEKMFNILITHDDNLSESLNPNIAFQLNS